jgi:hypothetical protein
MATGRMYASPHFPHRPRKEIPGTRYVVRPKFRDEPFTKSGLEDW